MRKLDGKSEDKNWRHGLLMGKNVSPTRYDPAHDYLINPLHLHHHGRHLSI